MNGHTIVLYVRYKYILLHAFLLMDEQKEKAGAPLQTIPVLLWWRWYKKKSWIRDPTFLSLSAYV